MKKEGVTIVNGRIYLVGDRVYFEPLCQYGTIINHRVDKAHPNMPEVHWYDIRLDSGILLEGVYSGIQPAEEKQSKV